MSRTFPAASWRLPAALLLSAATVAGLVSCSSSGDGGVGGTDQYLQRGAEIISDGATALEYVDLVEVSGDRDSTCVAVEAHRVRGVFAVAFTLSYDQRMLRYTGYDDDPTCVGSGSELLATLVDASQPGRLIVGVSRNGAQVSTGADTCGEIIRFCFDVVGQGDTRMDFTGGLRVSGPPPAGTVIAVEWVGAEVRTRT